MAVILKPLIDLHGAPKNWAASASLYFEALKDIPEDLLALAVKEAIRSNPFFPKPGDLRASIADVLVHRRLSEAKAREPAYLPAPTPRPPSAEDVAAVEALLNRTIRKVETRSEVLTDCMEES